MDPEDALTPEAFREQSGVSRETLARLEAYVALLQNWNRRINLVSRASFEDVWRRHVLDCSQLMNFLPPPPTGRPRLLLDLGSGAGLPGLILAILGAGEVHLVEADGRKAAFLREAARVAGAEIEIHACRIEALKPFPVDVVTARALAPLLRLLDLAVPFLGPEGRCLFLKGARAEAELEAARSAWDFSMESHPSCTYSSGNILVIGVNGRADTAS